MSTYRLENLFTPRSVALVGASARAHSIGHAVLRNLHDACFKGSIFPINPRQQTFRSLQDVPESPDLVVIASPADTVPKVIADAGKVGARAAIVLTAGLGHGPGSIAAAIEASARATGLRIVGPNCLGVISPRAKLNVSFAATVPKAGDLALISQSGAVAAGLMEWASARGIGFSAMISIGDAIDVDFGDLLDYFALDRATRHPSLRRVDPGAPQIHVRSTRGSTRKACHRGKGWTPPAGCVRSRNPHGSLGRLRRGLRRSLQPGRPAARARS
jgi:acetyltransferase